MSLKAVETDHQSSAVFSLNSSPGHVGPLILSGKDVKASNELLKIVFKIVG